MRVRLMVLAILLAACRTAPHTGSAPSAPAVPPAAAAVRPGSTTLHYSVVMSDNKAGTAVTTRSGNEIVQGFEFSDRGRGPKIHVVTTVDELARPVSQHATGYDYLHSPVEERFSIEGGTARWDNGAEQGEAPAGAFYWGMYGGDSELLVRAALKDGGKVRLLPFGTASVRRVDAAVIRGTHVTAYEIAGFGYEPREIWLDDGLNLFASGDPWFFVAREGYETDVKPLLDAQQARAKSRASQLAQKLTHIPDGGRLVVTNARVFDPRTGVISAPETVVTEGPRILSVGKESDGGAGTVIDAHGEMLLPGLWDMHQHFDRTDGALDIACGVTSARDLGNDETLLDLKKQFDEGTAIGPRLVMAGIVDGPGPYHGPTKMLADDEATAKKFIDYYAAHGYEGLKIYSSIRPELVPFMTRYAHEKKLRVSGHVPSGMTARQAVESGFDEIQHANMLFLNFMPDVKETRTPARFTEVASRGADLDLGSKDVRDFIALLRAHGTVVDPTLSVFEGMFTAQKGTPSPDLAPVLERLPVTLRRAALSGGLTPPEGMRERYAASFAKMLAMVKMLYDSGVPIVAGTDSYAGFALHRELELYAKAGIPAAEVLRIATLVPAQILGRERDLGTVEAGKLADFVLVDGDPTRNISDIRRITHVVKGGRVYIPAEIFPELGISN